MKKLFTLVALLAVFLGAKAEWVVDKELKYSSLQGFPFYVMGYVPEWVDGIMTDYGSTYRYATQATLDGDQDGKWNEGESSVGTTKTSDGTEYQKVTGAGPYWHQYFIMNQITTEIGGSYTVKAKVKASEACSIDLTMQWGWSEGQSITKQGVAIGTEWQEVEVDFNEVGANSCEIIAKPGTTNATIEWEYVIVGHNQKAQRPITWVEQLTNGDECAQMINKSLEQEIAAPNSEETFAMVKKAPVQTIDGDKVYVVNAPGVNVEGYKTTNVKGEDISGNYAWANQFFIVSPVPFKAGETIKVEFDYKADKDANTNTQAHGKPTYYQHYQLLDDVKFTSAWQHFTKQVTITDNQAGANGMYSIAFNLNPDQKEDNNYYFKNLSICTIKLDHGYFVAGANPDAGLDYDYDNAIEFKEEDGNLVATVGEKDAYVSQIMISTVRGHEASFKGATLKPTGTIENDPETWLNYDAAGIAKLNLPGVGIWKIYIDTEDKSMAFELIEGTAKEKPVINPNPIEITVNAVERDDLSDGTNQDGTPNVREGEGGTGEAWDNQFWIFANRPLQSGESTIIEFDYVADKEAKTTTQCQAIANGSTAYLHWAAIGDVTFKTDEQHFSKNFVIPADGAKATVNINGTDYEVTNHGIAFNMAEIKEACNYTIKNIVWKLEDGSESLIDQTGNKNFWVKIGAGTNPYPLSGETGIENVVEKSANASKATFNIAGQRVSKDFKGLVIKNGGKYLVK